MMRLVVALLTVAQLVASRYYQPSLYCDGGPSIQHLDKTMVVHDLQVTTVPVTLSQVYLNTVGVVQEVLADSLSPTFDIPPPGDLQATEVLVVQETHPLTMTLVDTVTSSIIKTEVQVSTQTGTNFVTQVETLALPTTVYVTVTEHETLFSQVTATAESIVTATLTVTTFSLLTDVVTQPVPQTTYVATSTALLTELSTNVHSLTKMVTQFVCPPDVA